MALPHCPSCGSPTTQANVSTLNCLSCGCVFDFAGAVVDQPDQGVPDPPEPEPVVDVPEPDDDPDDDPDEADELEAAEKPRKKLLKR